MDEFLTEHRVHLLDLFRSAVRLTEIITEELVLIHVARARPARPGEVSGQRRVLETKIWILKVIYNGRIVLQGK
jgi:hypothetical protein